MVQQPQTPQSSDEVHVIHQQTTDNSRDYDALHAAFSWEKERAHLTGTPGGGLNIAYEAVDRHVMQGGGKKTAIRWISKSGDAKDITYTELADDLARFAAVLDGLGVAQGEKVFALLGRQPELYITALGALRRGAVFCPLFSAFGPEPIKARIGIGEGAVLVTTRKLYEKKVAQILDDLPSLKHVLIVDEAEDLPEGTQSFEALMQAADKYFPVVETAPDDGALLHFTSGTTGKPKGALHVHEAVLAHHVSAQYALDLREDDIIWCTADPGWVTGTSYGIIAPLTCHATMIVDEGEFDVERWYSILQDQKVTVWYSAPTAIRMLMKAGGDLVQQYDLSALRFLASVGEPLNAEAVVWSHEVFGKPFHDNWWQTETGAIMIGNLAFGDIKPGSMGRPLPGIQAGIVEPQGDEGVREITKAGEVGELALKPGWPSMFRGYLHEDERYRKCFRGGWYLSGDLAMRDEDGYFWFVGRADDMIKSSGHFIGPFEVESALVAHKAVAEAAVIGVPDERAGEVVKAFVTLHYGVEPDEALRRDIMGHARRNLGAAVAPRMIEFTDELPKTRSGKIMRRLLKARELGLPEGDTSTLETFR